MSPTGFGDLTFGADTFGGVAISGSGIVGYTIEVDYSTPLLAVPTAWVDVTTYVRNFTIRRGRSHELGRMQAGEASLTLDNRDRRFDPMNTAGPYYPKVVPMRHLRISVTTIGDVYELFRGFIDDWGQQWSGPAAAGMGDATSEVHAVDAFAVFNLTDITSYPEEVLNDGPAFYYPLDGSEEQIMQNLGDENDAELENQTGPGALTFGAGPLLGGSLAMTQGGFDRGIQVLPTLDADVRTRFGGDWTVTAWLQRVGTNSGVFTLASAFRTVVGVTLTATHKIRVAIGGGSTFTSVDGTVSLPTGPHHVGVVKHGRTADIYVDGVFSETLTGLPLGSDDDPGPAGTQVSISCSPGTGMVTQVAAYDYALDPPRIAVQANARLGMIEPQTVDTALGAVLDATGWPSGLRNISTAGHTCSRHLPDSNALTELLKLAEETDGGVLFMTGDGKARFRSSDNLRTGSVLASWGDSSAELKYSDLTLRYDDQDLYSEVRATAEGLVDAVASDAPTAVTYGPRSLETPAGYLGTQNQLQDRSTGYLTRYKTPALRPETLVAVDSASQPTRTEELFAAEIGRKVSVTRRPPGGGSPITMTCLYEGVAYNPVEQLTQMRATLNLVPVLDATPWVLEDAVNGVLDSTTDLGW